MGLHAQQVPPRSEDVACIEDAAGLFALGQELAAAGDEGCRIRDAHFVDRVGLGVVLPRMPEAGVVPDEVYPIGTKRDGMPNWEPLPVKADYGKRNAYALKHLVATDERFKPQFMVDPLISNAWGLTIRPAGKGGHWWITNANSGTTTMYVGDAPGHPFGQVDLKVVPIPVGKLHAEQPDLKSQPTRQVYAGWN